tara:strand:+ start:59 stop:1729 length:1671 start_codon:yes stop_codon:yes gene_type:complete
MTVAQTIVDSSSKVFGDLTRFFSQTSVNGGDKEIDKWDNNSKDMIFAKSGSTVVLRPRIRSKKERDWLRGRFKSYIENRQSELEQEIIRLIPPKVAYNFTYEEEVVSGTGIKSYIIKATEEGKNRATATILLQSKGMSNGSGGAREDPHELMTAILIQEKMYVDYKKINRDKDAVNQYKEIVDKLYKAASKVQGAAGLNGFYTDSDKNEPDLVNLAKAVSVSNYIIDEIGNASVQTVWQTGTKWANEIKKYNVGPKTIQNYNSSDIIVKFQTKGKTEATHYWGLSLKKRGIGEPEPTLLNKPAYGAKGFLTKSIPTAEHKKIEDKKLEFFRGALKVKTGNTSYKGKEIDKMVVKDVLKACNTEFTNRIEKSEMLRGQGKYKSNPNIYFKEMDRVFIKYFDNNEEFFKEFLDTIFKINLDTYLQDAAFHFSLITGEGDYKNGQIFEVKKPLEKEGRLTSEIFRKIFSDPDQSAYRLVQQKDKPHAFEDTATAAKLFYEMLIGKPGKPISVVLLEVRYKGALTGEPQFQVFMSVKRNSFSNLYKQEAAKKTFGPDRWK